MRILEHTRVEPAEDVGRVVLSVGGANGGFERGGEVVSVEGICWAGEAWAACVR